MVYFEAWKRLKVRSVGFCLHCVLEGWTCGEGRDKKVVHGMEYGEGFVPTLLRRLKDERS